MVVHRAVRSAGEGAEDAKRECELPEVRNRGRHLRVRDAAVEVDEHHVVPVDLRQCGAKGVAKEGGMREEGKGGEEDGR